MGTIHFYEAIHIAQWQTSKETITDANAGGQREWALTPLYIIFGYIGQV